MLDNHPITPSLDLVDRWVDMLASRSDLDVFSKVAQWGADQELEACINYFCEYDTSFGENSELITGLRSTRRPKPPSLKDQALAVLMNAAICDHLSPQDEAILRRALEVLPE